jgi:Ca2+/Na+ antiporter
MTLEHIKKLMGWCPNVKTLENGTRISSANFETNDQSGGEKARNPGISSRISRLFSRFDIRILLPTLFLTPIYINLLFQKGINAEAFFLGFSLSLLIYLLGWKKQMHHYDSLTKKPVVGSSLKKTFFWVFLAIILFLILPIVFLSQIPSVLNVRSLYSLVAGAWIFMWGTYLQLIYWERKNHMKIYIKNEKGFQKIYAIGEKEGEL